MSVGTICRGLSRSTSSRIVALCLLIVSASFMLSQIPHIVSCDWKPDCPRSTGSYKRTHVLKEDFAASTDFRERAEIQQKNVTGFCRRYKDRISASTKDSPALLNHLYPKIVIDHLWFDEPKRVLFCAVPKIASSTMNRYFLVINGHKRSEELGPKRPSPKVLALVNKLRNLNETKQISMLESYYSFTIVRNPLERLVSGYRDKLEHESTFWYEKMQHRILDLFRRDELKAWESNNRSYELRPSFHEFIQYFVSSPVVHLDHHFRPFIEVCFPCSLKYDFYVSFKSFDNDINALFHHLALPLDSYPRRGNHRTHPTSQFVAKYFNQLPIDLKKRLKEKLDHELEFYYLFHPEDIANDTELLLG